MKPLCWNLQQQTQCLRERRCGEERRGLVFGAKIRRKTQNGITVSVKIRWKWKTDPQMHPENWLSWKKKEDWMRLKKKHRKRRQRRSRTNTCNRIILRARLRRWHSPATPRPKSRICCFVFVVVVVNRRNREKGWRSGNRKYRGFVIVFHLQNQVAVSKVTGKMRPAMPSHDSFKFQAQSFHICSGIYF